MKTCHRIALSSSLCFAVASALGQFSPPGGAPGRSMQSPAISKSMARLFGENQAYSAAVEMQNKASGGGAMTMPGKLAFDHGNSRFEMDLSKMQGGPGAGQMAQMKTMGIDMEKMVVISRADKKLNYLVYPGMSAYMEMTMQDPDAGKADADFKVEYTELGKETVEGHACVKNKAVITDKEGNKHEATVWHATDLKQFPVRIDQTENGATMTMLFKEVTLSKPAASQFEPPADCKKYDSQAAMMQEVIMKHMSGGAGAPPPK